MTLILPHHPTCHPWPRPFDFDHCRCPVTPLFALWALLLTLPLWPLFDLWPYTSPLRIPLFTHFIRDPILCLVTTSTSMWPVFLTVVPIISLWTSFLPCDPCLWPTLHLWPHPHFLWLLTTDFSLWPHLLLCDLSFWPSTAAFALPPLCFDLWYLPLPSDPLLCFVTNPCDSKL